MKAFHLNAELLGEEIFWRMVNLGKIEQVKVVPQRSGAVDCSGNFF